MGTGSSIDSFQMEYYELWEEPLFSQQRDSLGACKRLDDVLAGVTWSLTRSPEEWPLIPGTGRTRLAKTVKAPDAPALYVWFTVETDGIHLQSIELAPESD